MSVDPEMQLRERYVRLCANPLRGEAQILEELEELKGHPRVKYVGFRGEHVLLVGTDLLVVKDEFRLHRKIGEFIIFLLRRESGGYWETDFRFWNVTNPLTYEVDEGRDYEVGWIHPHIMPADDQLLSCPNGALCISRGQFPVHQFMRKGQMHLAAPALIDILETYPTGTPYKEAHYWPLMEGEYDGV